MNVESQQERRRLRAAMESMRRKRSMAVGGFVAALGLVIMADVYSFFPQSVLWAMRLAALVVLLLFFAAFSAYALSQVQWPLSVAEQPVSAS